MVCNKPFVQFLHGFKSVLLDDLGRQPLLIRFLMARVPDAVLVAPSHECGTSCVIPFDFLMWENDPFLDRPFATARAKLAFPMEPLHDVCESVRAVGEDAHAALLIIRPQDLRDERLALAIRIQVDLNGFGSTGVAGEQITNKAFSLGGRATQWVLGLGCLVEDTVYLAIPAIHEVIEKSIEGENPPAKHPELAI